MSKIALFLALLLQDSEARPRRVVLDLPAEGMLAIAGKAVPWADLAPALKRHAEAGVRQLVLRVEGSVPFSSVQQLMASAREAGIEGVQFSTERPAAAFKFSDEARRSVRIKVREGAKGLELLVLEESTAVSLDDLRKKLKALEKGPVVVDAEFEVPYGAVREIVAACTEEGFDKVSFAGGPRKPGAIRVLYAEETPRWEYRYLRNMLERSGEFALDVHLAAADPGFPGVLGSFPRDLSPYQVVLMGELKELGQDERRGLVDFVNRGGGVVWMAGAVIPPDWLGHALKGICPVTLGGGTRARMRPSEGSAWVVKDAQSPLAAIVDWKALRAEFWIEQEVAKVDPDARVVVEAAPAASRTLRDALRELENEERKAQGLPPIDREGENPLLVTQAVGKGRAVFVSVTNTHVWRERTGDRPAFAPFWTGVLRWTARR